MHDLLAQELLDRTSKIEHLLEKLLDAEREILHVLRHPPKSRITGGSLRQIGHPMLPIQPGNAPQFQVTPTFSGSSFTPVPTACAVTSSDTVNFPVALDATGRIITANIPATAVVPTGGEVIVITWTYTNLDGTVATVVGNVTETGIVVPPSDITGGTMAQVV